MAAVHVIMLGLAALFVGVVEVDASKLQMMPRYLQVARGVEASFLCTLRDESGQPVPLAGCGFRDDERNTWDFSDGPASTHDERGRYYGDGLSRGQCGITIKHRVGYVFLGCRVRPAAGGGWQYEAALLLVLTWDPLQFTQQPRSVLALPGSNVSITGLAERQLGWCYFNYPTAEGGVLADFDSGLASNSTSAARYLGSGLDHKQCGVTLLNVQPERSGFVRGDVQSSSPYASAMDFTELIVLEAPSSRPQLALNSPSAHFTAGDTLLATCLVKQSRPVANITWYLGSRVERQDELNEEPVTSEWQWNHEPRSITQHLSLSLALSDDGQVLKCRAGHLAWPSGSSDSDPIVIRVTRPSAKDPCQPNPCGPNSVCQFSGALTLCSCKPDHIGQPPSCLKTPEAKDPCQPNPCGPNSVCQFSGALTLCSCVPDHIGQPPSCRPECVGNTDCPSLKACVSGRCEDPCGSTSCGGGAACHVIYHTAECRCPSGTQGDPEVRCEEEDCGLPSFSPQLLAGGQNADYGENPWHAGLYVVETVNNQEVIKQICGGTLVKQDIVITAAHCVYDDIHQRLREAATLRVALGKILRDWHVDLNISDIQRFNVTNIQIHEEYVGRQHNLLHDIAILKLTYPAVMTEIVQLACLDWDISMVQLAAGNIGTIAGWGLTGNGSQPASTLQWLELPWVNRRTCLNSTHLGARRFLTYDKFCAGYMNSDTSVCPGDSGGGLLFQNNATGRFYLRGITSTSLANNINPHLCAKQHYTSFTKLDSISIKWIKEYVFRV